MPGGSRPGKRPGLNRSRDLLASSSRPNTTCAICPSAAGKARHAPGLAAKPLASANCRACAGSPAQIASHVALVANVMGIADVAGEVWNTECMLFSVFHWGRGGREAQPRRCSFFAYPQSLAATEARCLLHAA